MTIIENEMKLFPKNPILIMDDDDLILSAFKEVFLSKGISNILCLNDSKKLNHLISNQKIESIILDLGLPKINGEEILVYLSREFPEIPVIIVTGVNEIATAVDCMRYGAVNYLVKPVEPEKLLISIKHLITINELKRENQNLKNFLLQNQPVTSNLFSEIITNDKKLHSIFQYSEVISKTMQPVLITGETGTGKELFAKCIHKLSGRQGKFICVNVAGLDDPLFSDTLFGHKKGAYTGAESYRDGLIKKAEGGTLLLDEIGDLDTVSQIKLLRVIQEKEYFPIGSDTPIKLDVRFISTTHKDLFQFQNFNGFRKDLYFRISTHNLEIPPLRERLNDIPLLLEFFIKQTAQEMNKKITSLPNELITLLSTYYFPGNIRELQSMVYNAVAQHKRGVLSTKPFREAIAKFQMNKGEKTEGYAESGVQDYGLTINNKFLFPTLKTAEKFLIFEALKRTKGNQVMASEYLGVPRQTLQRKIKKYNLEKDP